MVVTDSLDNMVMLGDRHAKRLPDNLVDLFCGCGGCGGSGGGLLDAAELLERRVQGTFVNHWDKAIQIHSENHPEHRHLEEDLFLLDPSTVFPPGTHCSLLWASPQCTFFSVARGASCVNEQDRSHANHLEDWVKHLNPEAVICENVKEFRDWGPVIQKRHPSGKYKGELMWARNAKPVKELPEEHLRREGEEEAAWAIRMMRVGYYQPYEVPDKNHKGEYFDAWVAKMESLGYEVDHRLLKSADYGDPTIRTRLFVYMVRKDTGKKIVWPDPYAGEKGTDHGRPMNWRTARDIIDWSLKGESVFTRKKKLADNTFRRLAIGLVKYGLKEFLVSSAHGTDHNCRVHSPDEPLKTLTSKGDKGVVKAEGEFLTPNFGERPGQTPRTHDVDQPVPTVTSHGAGGIVESEAYMLPKDGGHKQDYVRGVDHPVGGITTKSHEVLVESEARAVPMVDRNFGTGVVKGVDEPLRTELAGGRNQALAEAFMFTIDQTGGAKKNDGTYPVDEPVRTLVTKANQSCIEMDLEEVSDTFLKACDERGVETERATAFLDHLITELKRRGKVDAKPWIYVYYSSGSEGKEIDAPLPAVRTKAGHALVYPVVELDGRLIKIDLFYRMLTPLELQRAMGFPDEMEWAGATKTETIRAIGNSVSRGVARALGLAWYSQDPDVWTKVKHLYEH